jgi:hypothetical protein
VIDRLERAGFARRERDRHDRRKILVRALPAVERFIVPLFEPMERAVLSALSDYSDKELALLLDFFARARDAAAAAMTALRAQAKPAGKARRGPRKIRGSANEHNPPLRE